VAAHLLGFILFDGAGVRLFLGDAHRFECIENGVALDFQFSCQVVDANFAHLFLFEGRRSSGHFGSTARLAGHISLK
jgi:hypothetical protein